LYYLVVVGELDSVVVVGELVVYQLEQLHYHQELIQ
jgi:hypothetical protein